ncbi:hypothetical protein VaNZ11_005006 [Volvox africanus]|uniref:F-box domain-containing protein n=1 Tax=Volvox africanus TaxID=51714 RepID=A0ABQ5RXN4_9CHLO|nr:hypothetical protein VaNZ11_005006 [Volvox africanus]
MPALRVSKGDSDAANLDWSTLPPLVLCSIVQHVDDALDLASMRLTCRRWSKNVTQNSQAWRLRGPVARFHWGYLRGTLYMLCPVAERLALVLSNRTSCDTLAAMFNDLNWWSRLREIVLVAIRPVALGLFGPGLDAKALVGLSSLRALQALVMEGCDTQMALDGALGCTHLTKLAIRSRRSPLGNPCRINNNFLDLLAVSQQAISLGQPLPRRTCPRHRNQLAYSLLAQDGANGGGGGGGAFSFGGQHPGDSGDDRQESEGLSDCLQREQGLNPALERELETLFRENHYGKSGGSVSGNGGGGTAAAAAAAAAADQERDERTSERGARLGGSAAVAAGPPRGGLRHLEFDADAHLDDAASMMALLESEGPSSTITSDRLNKLLAALPSLEHLDIRRVPVHAPVIQGGLAQLTNLTELRIGIQDGRDRHERRLGSKEYTNLSALGTLNALAAPTAGPPWRSSSPALLAAEPPWLPPLPLQSPPAPQQQHAQDQQQLLRRCLYRQHRTDPPPPLPLQQPEDASIAAMATATATMALDANPCVNVPPPGPALPMLHLYISRATKSSPMDLLGAMLPLVPRLQTLFMTHRTLHVGHLISVGQLTSLECLGLSLTPQSHDYDEANGTDRARGRRMQCVRRLPRGLMRETLEVMRSASCEPEQRRMLASLWARIVSGDPAVDINADMDSCLDSDDADMGVLTADPDFASDPSAPTVEVCGIGLEALRHLTQLRELHLRGPQRIVGLAARVAAGLQAMASHEVPEKQQLLPPPPQPLGTRPITAGPANGAPVGGTDDGDGKPLLGARTPRSSSRHKRQDESHGNGLSEPHFHFFTPMLVQPSQHPSTTQNLPQTAEMVDPAVPRLTEGSSGAAQLPGPSFGEACAAAAKPAATLLPQTETGNMNARMLLGEYDWMDAMEAGEEAMTEAEAVPKAARMVEDQATAAAAPWALPFPGSTASAGGSAAGTIGTRSTSAHRGCLPTQAPCHSMSTGMQALEAALALAEAEWDEADSDTGRRDELDFDNMREDEDMEDDIVFGGGAAEAGGRGVCGFGGGSGSHGAGGLGRESSRVTAGDMVPSGNLRQLIQYSEYQEHWQRYQKQQKQQKQRQQRQRSVRKRPDSLTNSQQRSGGRGSGGRRRGGRGCGGNLGGITAHCRGGGGGGSCLGLGSVWYRFMLALSGKDNGDEGGKLLAFPDGSNSMDDEEDVELEVGDVMQYGAEEREDAPGGSRPQGSGHLDKDRDLVLDLGLDSSANRSRIWRRERGATLGGRAARGGSSLGTGINRRRAAGFGAGAALGATAAGTRAAEAAVTESVVGSNAEMSALANLQKNIWDIMPLGEVPTPLRKDKSQQGPSMIPPLRSPFCVQNCDQPIREIDVMEDLAREHQMPRRALLSLQWSDIMALRTHGSVLEALTLYYFRMPPTVIAQLTSALPRLRRLGLRWTNDQEAEIGKVPCSCSGSITCGAVANAGTGAGTTGKGRGRLEIETLPPLLESLELGGPVTLVVTASGLGGPCGSRQAPGPVWAQLRRLTLSKGIDVSGAALPALLERTPQITELQLLRPRGLEPADLESLGPLTRLRFLVVDLEPEDMECREVRRAMARGISCLAGLTALQELRWDVPDPPSRKRRLHPACPDDKPDHKVELCQQLSTLTGLHRLSLLSLPSCRNLLERIEDVQALRHLPFLELSS